MFYRNCFCVIVYKIIVAFNINDVLTVFWIYCMARLRNCQSIGNLYMLLLKEWKEVGFWLVYRQNMCFYFTMSSSVFHTKRESHVEAYLKWGSSDDNILGNLNFVLFLMIAEIQLVLNTTCLDNFFRIYCVAFCTFIIHILMMFCHCSWCIRQKMEHFIHNSLPAAVLL